MIRKNLLKLLIVTISILMVKGSLFGGNGFYIGAVWHKQNPAGKNCYVITLGDMHGGNRFYPKGDQNIDSQIQALNQLINTKIETKKKSNETFVGVEYETPPAKFCQAIPARIESQSILDKTIELCRQWDIPSYNLDFRNINRLSESGRSTIQEVFQETNKQVVAVIQNKGTSDDAHFNQVLDSYIDRTTKDVSSKREEIQALMELANMTDQSSFSDLYSSFLGTESYHFNWENLSQKIKTYYLKKATDEKARMEEATRILHLFKLWNTEVLNMIMVDQFRKNKNKELQIYAAGSYHTAEFEKILTQLGYEKIGKKQTKEEAEETLSGKDIEALFDTYEKDLSTRTALKRTITSATKPSPEKASAKENSNKFSFINWKKIVSGGLMAIGLGAAFYCLWRSFR